MASRVSLVALPMCGIRKVLGSSRYSGWMSGSLLYTSRPAAASLPLFSAAMSASSSMTAPRRR